LILLFRGQKHALPFPVVRRTVPDIYRDVKCLALNDATELCLWMMQLVMKAAYCELRRTRMVILHERIGNPELSKFFQVICFHEKSPCVAEDPRVQLPDTGK